MYSTNHAAHDALRVAAIIALCVGSAVTYGVIHDQVTARVCVEYFTIGHPPIFGTDNPTLLGLCWGVVATWWVGLVLGVPLALTARLGSRPRIDARSLVVPLLFLMLGSGLFAALLGVVGWQLASHEVVYLIGPIADQVPVEKHAAFLADGFAHVASYASGFLGGILLAVYVWRCRALQPGTLQLSQLNDLGGPTTGSVSPFDRRMESRLATRAESTAVNKQNSPPEQTNVESGCNSTPPVAR